MATILLIKILGQVSLWSTIIQHHSVSLVNSPWPPKVSHRVPISDISPHKFRVAPNFRLQERIISH